MDYLRVMEDNYKLRIGFNGDDYTRLEFLAENVFDIFTYEDEVSAIMVEKCVEICEAISNRATLNYIRSSDENNQWYLVLAHIVFFSDKLEWGSSIRGAWWNVYDSEPIKFITTALYCDDNESIEHVFSPDEWDKFIKAVIQFYKGGDNE